MIIPRSPNDDLAPMPTAQTRTERSATRRVLNVRLVVASLLGLAVVVPSIYLWHQRQMRNVAQAMLAEAESHEQSGDYPRAARYLYRCLQLEEDDAKRAELLVRLARNYDRASGTAGEKASVVNWYYRAIAASPQDVSLKERLAELFLETQQYVLAEEQAESLLRDAPTHGAAARIRALARYGHLRRGRPMPAERVLRELQDVNRREPGNVEVADALAWLYHESGSGAGGGDAAAQAESVMETLVRNAPDNYRAFLSRHEYQQQRGAGNDREDLRRALQLAPEQPRVLLASAEQARRDGRYAEALEQFRRLVQQEPTELRGHLGLGETLYLNGQPREAVDAWRAALRSVGRGQAMLRVRMADVLIEEGQLRAADEELKQIDVAIRHLATGGEESQRDWLGTTRDLLKGKSLVRQQQYRDAVPLLQRVSATGKSARGQDPESTPGYQAWMLLGQCHLRLQAWEEAAQSFQRALEVVPNSVAARVWAAEAWAMVGREEDALWLCRQAIARPGAPEAVWLLAAQLEFRLQARRPPHLRDWQPLESLLDQAATALPENWQLTLVRANVLLLRDGLPGTGRVVQLLLAEEARHPQTIALWGNLVFLYERMGMRSEADRALARLAELQPGAPQTVAWQATVLALRGQLDDARKSLQAALDSRPNDPDGWLDRALLFVAHQQGDTQVLQETLMAVAERHPQSVEVLSQLADLAIARNEAEETVRWIESLRSAEGDQGVWWRFFAARRALARSERAESGSPAAAEATAEAASLYEEIRQLCSWWPGAELLRALLAEAQGRGVEAVDAYAKAIQSGFQQPFVFQHLVRLLYQQGRFEEADAWLTHLRQQAPVDARTLDLAWSSAMQRDQSELALEFARKNVEAYPAEASAHAWLGQLLLLSGRADEARQAIDRAEALQPADVATCGAMLTFHLRVQDEAKALAALERLRNHPTLDDARRHAVAAETYVRLGMRAEAVREFEAGLQALPADHDLRTRYAAFEYAFDATKAEQMVREVLRQKPDHAAARQLLASWLHWQVDARSREESRELLGARGANWQQQASDQRLEAMLLIRRGQPEDLRTARELLERLADDPRFATAEDQVLLAHLNEKSGDVASARRRLQTLATGEAVPARHLAAYIDFLLRQGETSEAREPIARLEQQAPDRFSTVLLRARWLQATGAADQVEPNIESFTQRQLASAREPQQRQMLMQQAAELLLALERSDAAERWFRRMASEFPAQREFLTRHWQAKQNHGEAIRYALEGLDAEATPAAAALLARVLTFCPEDEMRKKPQVSERAEAMFASLVEKHPQDADLLFSLSNLRLKQGRLDDAIQLLRRLTASNPRHVTGWNNLAALLSEDPRMLREALDCIDRALASAGRPLGNLLDTKALVLLQMDQNAQAASLLVQAMSLPDANDPRFAFHLAVAQRRLGQHAEAMQAWKRAQELGLDDAFLTGFEKRLASELNTWIKEQGA